MNKEELQAANERLGAEVAALRELLAVIGTAMPATPADDDGYRTYYGVCRERLRAVAQITACAMDYAGQRTFYGVLHNSALTLRRELEKPLRYTPETAAPVGRTVLRHLVDGAA